MPGTLLLSRSPIHREKTEIEENTLFNSVSQREKGESSMNNNLEAGEFKNPSGWIKSGIQFLHCRFPSPPII